MKSTLAVGLVLVLISVALANEWIQPGKCVRLYSSGTGKRLASSNSKHDADRRYVETVMAGLGDLWVIRKDERYPDHYKIKHKKSGEELFESKQNYHGNYIFTWVPKTLINDGGASWNIMWANDGNYKLKNKKFNNCLWNGDGKMTAFEACDNAHFMWKIFIESC